ncbi:hypothetical protein GOBAR_AA13115 [Gossypium barbadense]|uniref:Disease resistance protein At4g27190-like leucine-rich repeats domain-containing protein n=1 Tax=Gossypium barbadense TaxID=3634 RepID=A0A2P5XW33_GOSBA|nr:hypothetical protein GOBAR_AA13115 [Gossypium barbadense]
MRNKVWFVSSKVGYRFDMVFEIVSLAKLNTLSHLSTLEVEIPDAKAAPEDFFQKLQKLERYKIFIGKEWERFSYSTNRIKKLVKRTQYLELDELKGVKIALKELTDEERLPHLQNLHVQNGLDIESITNDRNEFPGLQSLTLQGLPQLVSFCSQDKIDATSLPQRELPLSGEKISFPSLEKLQLSSLNVTRVAFPNLEKVIISFLRKMKMIWRNPLPPNSFPKLQVLVVEGSSIAKDLPKLGYLAISHCGVEEIVSKLEEGSDSETAVNFEFDQLYDLILWKLPELKCFYPGKHTSKWPTLNKLEVVECGKMKILGTHLNTNNGQLDSPIHPPLFLVIPRLQHLTLDSDYIAMISDGQFSSSPFHEIKAFEVHGHTAKSIDFRISFLERFYTLESLIITYCEIKELFCSERDIGSSSASFQNLTTLDVRNCEAMKYLDTCLAVQGMAQLKKLRVRDCISMKEIVATEGGEATCDIISAVCGKDNGHWCSDLNNTIQEMYSIKAGFEAIEYLVLSEFSRSIEIWKENVHGSLDFKNLKVLEVYECNTMTYIFSVSMALDLVQLEDIKVKQCPMMEQIIKGAEETEMDILLLPKLQEIRLESCSRLTSFCMGSITLECPSLYKIAVDDCPKMYTMASTSEQEDIEIVGREKTPFFNHKVLCAHLKYLKLSSTNIKNLWPDKPDRAISSNVLNLQCLFVKRCHNLEYLFPSILVKNFERLYLLSLHNCENMEEIIFTDGLAAAAEDGMGKCRKIWHDKLTKDSFHELTFLEVEQCDKLLNVLPIDMVERLEKLEGLEISKCESVEEIIGLADDRGLNSNESIELKSTTDKVETFAGEYINFRETQGENQSVISVRQPLFWVTKETFPNLEELVLARNGNMKVWHGHGADLKQYCPKLRKAAFNELFPCEGVRDENERAGALACLKELRLYYLPDLTHI